jgi:hypothetical protein
MRALWMSTIVLAVGCRDKAEAPAGEDKAASASGDLDGDGYDTEDCDDANSSINPGASEICDGIDNNCDGVVDEGVTSTFYADTDADGFGDEASPVESCSEPTGYVAVGNDCDDTDAETYPAASERCDGIDNDCDTLIDEDVTSTWYADTDADSYGDPDASLGDCDPPSGYVSDDTDCDDSDASSFPGNKEVCDEADNDCDTLTDEDVTTTFYQDSDRDGYGLADKTTEACAVPSGYAAESGDCDDSSAAASPAAAEYCDGADNDCDTFVDEDDALDASTFYADTDADGYGDKTSTTESCSQPTGYVTDATDCDDSDSDTRPGADEYCDGEDDDCDGSTDEGAVDAPTWYIDYDSDGYGVDTYTLEQCEQPAGYLSDSSDCDDTDAAIYPGAAEYCDGIDSDCDSVLDEDDALDAETFYADTDADGYGDAANTTESCSLPSGYVTDSTDCDDGEADAWPGSTATEVPFDGIDTDCDGNDYCTDLNCDGLTDLLQAVHYSGSSYATSSRIYYNTGSGFSDTDVDTVSTSGTYDAAVSDVDGDGYQDLIFANYRSDSSYSIDSYVYYGSSTGYSASDRDSLPTVGALHLAVEDLDDDGYEDIVFANYYNGSSYAVDSYVYYGSSTGYSTSNRESIYGSGGRRVRIADVDDDGDSDIVLCSYYNGSYSVDSYVYYGTASGYSSSSRDALPTLGCRDIQVGDLNDDGVDDIVFANYYSGSSYTTSSYIYYGTASGFSTAYRDSLPTTGSLSAAIADFDQDGYDDVAFGGYHNGSWSSTATSYVYYNSSLGLSSSIYDSFALNGVYRIKAEDLDGNGYPELILPSYYSGSGYSTSSYIYYGAASGLTTYDALPTIGASKVATGDIDGDGLPEVIFNNYYSGSWSTLADSYVYYGTASGYSTADRDSLSTQGSWPEPILVGPGN